MHSASIMTLDDDPHKVVPGVIAFALNALKATYAEPCAQRFVFCSSSTAAILSTLDKPGVVVNDETWNEEAVEEVWANTSLNADRSHTTYSASKTLAEQAIWKYYNEHFEERPDIVVNTGKSYPGNLGVHMLIRS